MRAQTLRILTHYYGVSADYILGLSNNPYHISSEKEVTEFSEDVHKWMHERNRDYEQGNACSLDALLSNPICQRVLEGLLKYCAVVSAAKCVKDIFMSLNPSEKANFTFEELENFEQTYYGAIEEEAMRHPNKAVSKYMIAMMQLMKQQTSEWSRGLVEIDFNYYQLVDMVAYGVEKDLRWLMEDLLDYEECSDIPHKEEAARQFWAKWKFKFLERK